MAESDDDAVHELLRAAMADDAVPEAVLAEAQLIPQLRRFDADLAELLAEPALTRDGDATDVFTVDDVHVTVTVEQGGVVVDVQGLADPTVELLAGEVPVAAVPAGLRFRIATTHTGPARVRVTGAERTVVTEWFTLC